ncbi:MAG: hypothetical protein NTV88_00125, partial [Candidatus Micrarchaeota archaeon]|nr:hypothetical protein [Candidatus Micrarchaeota archaeon]
MMFLFDVYRSQTLSANTLLKSINAQIEQLEKDLFAAYQKTNMRDASKIRELSKSLVDLYSYLATIRNSSEYSSLGKTDQQLVLRGFAFCHEAIDKLGAAYLGAKQSPSFSDDTLEVEIKKLNLISQEIESIYPVPNSTKADQKKLSDGLKNASLPELTIKASTSEKLDFSDELWHYTFFTSLLDYAYRTNPENQSVFVLDSVETLIYLTHALEKARKKGASDLTTVYFKSAEYAKLFKEYVESLPYATFNGKETRIALVGSEWGQGTPNAVILRCGFDERRTEKEVGSSHYPLPEEVAITKTENIFTKEYKTNIDSENTFQKSQEMDAALLEMDKKEENLEAKNGGDVTSKTRLAYEYGNHYVGANAPSLANTSQSAYTILRTKAIELGYRIKTTLEEFLPTEEGLRFLSEPEVKNLVIEGRATLEDNSSRGYKNNTRLSQERANMLREAIMDIIKGSISQEQMGKYMPDIQTQTNVVSMWGTEGVPTMTKYMFFLKRMGYDEQSPDYLNATDSERKYARAVYNILLGNYADESLSELQGTSFMRKLSKYSGRTSAVSESKDENGNAYYYVNNDALMRLFICRMPGDPTGGSHNALGMRFEGHDPSEGVQQMGAMFVRMLEYDFSRSAGLVGGLNADLDLKIMSTPKTSEPNKETKVEFSVGYKVNGTDRDYLETENDKLRVYVRKSDGTHYQLSDNEVSYDEKKKVYVATFIAPDKDFTVFADVNRQELSSGYVWKKMKVETFEIWKPFVEAKNAHGLPGTYENLPFTAYKKVYEDENDAEPKRTEGVSTRIAFGVRLKGDGKPKYFETPGEIKLSEELVYRLNSKNIGEILNKSPSGAEKNQDQIVIVDRGLVVEGKTYSGDQLVALAKSGVVAIKAKNFQAADIWISLDGAITVNPEGLTEKDGFLYSKKADYSLRDVLQTAPSTEKNIIFPAIKSGSEMSTERSHIKRSILLPENDVMIGDEKYSARKIRNLAKEHIIAIVANKVADGKTIATVYDLNG